MDKVLETTDLTKVLQGRAVVNRVNLSIPGASIYGIVGANGAGKSTLLRLIVGLMWPDTGEIRLFGKPLPRDAAEFRQRVHLVASDGQIYSSFHVEDLIRYASGLYQRWDQKRCDTLIDVLELPRKRRIKSLSSGMRMQLKLTVSLSAHPDLLLLDEPTNGLDAVVKRQFLQLILDEAARDGTTIVMATHAVNDLERMADAVAVMYHGRIIADGVVDDLKTRIRSYQVVLQNGLPQAVRHHNRVLHTQQRGSVWTVVAQDPDGTVRAMLSAESTHVELVPLDLEEVFTYLLAKEGYSRDSILLA
ncbi:ABC transporter ATP-binding protein [Alicyclobacillus sp. SO9]|uniref:ABC transporter ATP-binding protein n=1 Tax=Alicyclobacillus sp. SO9 TaxID=2665646 RepID=UPI0018E6DFAD|nr:ABC transporter ATP-binding protein [Alicyclobacillus sp. SO9]QQE79872.1 ABC transporter ATP-binding protein [Alicyclobacillus sp. SO9]